MTLADPKPEAAPVPVHMADFVQRLNADLPHYYAAGPLADLCRSMAIPVA